MYMYISHSTEVGVGLLIDCKNMEIGLFDLLMGSIILSFYLIEQIMVQKYYFYIMILVDKSVFLSKNDLKFPRSPTPIQHFNRFTRKKIKSENLAK